jgi:hypothetical protein
MSAALVEVDLTPLARSGLSQNVTGEIWFDLDGEPFPAAHWDDFIVTLLGWWTDDIRALAANDVAVVTLQFMDGPFGVMLEATGPDTWRATPTSGASREALPRPRAIQVAELVGSVVHAADAVLVACRLRGWKSRDIRRLEQNLGELRASLQFSR